MVKARLSASELAVHLSAESDEVRRAVRALREMILREAPEASEGIKFGVLCYYHDDAFLKSIGGNICMIEVKRGKVLLSFIRGVTVADPKGLLYGKGKYKRFMDVPDAAFAKRADVKAVIRAAAKQKLMEGPEEPAWMRS
jgi:hypothetical protein